VNVFCHRPAIADAAVEAAWIARLKPEFDAFGAEPPSTLHEIYKTFRSNGAMTALLLETRPAVVSFHFGLPPQDQIRALKEAGIILFGSATNLAEARQLAEAGIDAIVAQGYEAGGHRGLFDYAAPDDRLGTVALTRLLVHQVNLPIIAAGGIMDGAGIAAMLRLGATAAQLGTAFVGCPESAADQGYRAALASQAAYHTVMTRAISGRPARCLANRFTKLAESVPDAAIPDYPITYDMGKALIAAAKAKGEFGFGAQWAGQGAPLSRPMPAAELVRLLAHEMRAA
jgi:nitronate monooxygenase